jgi:MFS family permease
MTIHAAAATHKDSNAALFSRQHAPLALGAVALVTLGAFGARAVQTTLPTIATEFSAVGSLGVVTAAPITAFVVALVVTGIWADRAGPLPVLRAGIITFIVAQLAVGLSSGIPAVIAGRLLAGFAEGFLDVGLMVLIARALPEQLRARMFSLFAAAWIVPSVFGPPLAGLVTEQVGWRWVFLGMAVVAIPTWLLLAPAIRMVREAGASTGGDIDDSKKTPGQLIPWAVAAAVGMFTLTVAGSSASSATMLRQVIAVSVIVLASGVVITSAIRLLPAGTFRFRRGLPAVVGTRMMASLAFGVTGTWLPILLTLIHGFRPTFTGISLTITGVMWFVGSWLNGRDHNVPPVVVLRAGMVLMAAGLLIASTLVATSLPPYVGLTGWAIAAIGMGLAWPVLAVLVLGMSDDSNQGRNNAAAHLAGSIGLAVGLAVSGTAVAFAAPEPGRGVFVAIILGSTVIAAVGAAVSGRVAVAQAGSGDTA